MPFVDTFCSRAGRYAIGTESPSGRRYLSIPVSNRRVDYEEHYGLTEAEAQRFLAEPELALQFADACRARLHDDRLLTPPGSDRGVAS
ncbi:MAG: hypothetical protein V4764_03110 [Burkholderia sp.]